MPREEEQVIVPLLAEGDTEHDIEDVSESLDTPPVDSKSKHEAMYDRFSPQKKKTIVGLISWAGLLPFLVSGTFIPTIPQIAEDLHSTGTVVSVAVSLSVLAIALGSMFGATYSTFYGRRPVYLVGLPLMCAASVAVGLSQSIPQLLTWRVVQSLGAAPGISVGAGVIGDIYRLDQRGTAMGIYFGACLLGPALAPTFGGLAAHYGSWRIAQYVLSLLALASFLSMYMFFPETSHPGARGIDKLRQERGARVRFIFVNPLKSLSLLKSPNLVADGIVSFLILLTNYVLLVPLAYTIGVRYNITNEALIGACFLPCGFGNIVGANIAGRLSDQSIIKWRKIRNGVWVPEDRLRAALIPAATLVPLSVLLSGLITQYVDGVPGLVLNLVCLFCNGFGVDMVLSPCGSYCVDILHDRSAESMAAMKGLRSLLVSFCIAGILPSVNTYGQLATNIMCAILTWMGFGILYLMICFGDHMRSFVDMGYTTADNT